MDQKEIELIYKETKDQLFNFLFKYTLNPETALDLLQESFLKFQQYYGGRNLSLKESQMLLYRIARNLSINHSKKFSTTKESHSEVDRPDRKISVEKQMIYKDLEEKLHECLEELPENQKTVIILKNIEGLNLTKIAEIMEVSIASVSRLLVKATGNLIKTAEEKEILP